MNYSRSSTRLSFEFPKGHTFETVFVQVGRIGNDAPDVNTPSTRRTTVAVEHVRGQDQNGRAFQSANGILSPADRESVARTGSNRIHNSHPESREAAGLLDGHDLERTQDKRHGRESLWQPVRLCFFRIAGRRPTMRSSVCFEARRVCESSGLFQRDGSCSDVLIVTNCLTPGASISGKVSRCAPCVAGCHVFRN